MAHKIARDRKKESLWRERLNDQATSGLTIAEWCRRNGVAGSLFHFWKRTIARRNGGRVRPGTKSPARPKDPVLFAPVVLVPPPQLVQPDPLPGGGVIEIVLAGARVVRVGAGFDEATLTRVLAVLEGRPC